MEETAVPWGVYRGQMKPPYRVGTGHDVHRLVDGYALVLGGVYVPSAVGFKTHSDGDVLSHSLVDALAGAIADGDLGTHFPEDDTGFRNATVRDPSGPARRQQFGHATHWPLLTPALDATSCHDWCHERGPAVGLLPT